MRELGISNEQRLRDVWRWKDVGKFLDTYGADGRHGVVVVRMWPVQ